MSQTKGKMPQWNKNASLNSSINICMLQFLFSLGCCIQMPQSQWFKQQSLISHSPEGWQVQVKVLARSVLGEDSLLGLWTPAFNLWPLMASPGCVFILLCYAMLSHFSHVRLYVTPEMAAHQAPPSLGFSRQEHWSGLPFPSPMHESEKRKWSCSVVSDS